MLLYDYECEACNVRLELEQSIHDERQVKCPECGADALKRIISKAPVFTLSGNCWYRDGYTK